MLDFDSKKSGLKQKLQIKSFIILFEPLLAWTLWIKILMIQDKKS